ncbi:TonB-dependent receptor [Zobellia galactanivorans]|uniref:TonB-dependent Receptor n=1 Tax=Zobellia galactanivorans (strain DSM 12802 / CCUG 47099 / CIP 106680 / NCIMB 13871 / Dsij) TaxID=63186 RepID=G0L1E5_ZOBGA|nr:TonB-dependent receptor [Zobellia galactanivorans]CAZ94641.1 TonB-dependent Receptor [Zobellia galactanivorans]
MKKAICCTSFFLVLFQQGHAKTSHPPSPVENGIHKNRRLAFVIKNNYLPPDQDKEKYTISGYVTESGSGEHLLGVSVYVPELKLGTTTNDYGFFSLTLPEGNHEVIISYIGYGNEKQQINLSEDQILSIALKPSTQNLEEVVVTADERIKESKVTQMSKVQINPADIQDIPALLGEKDVMKTLQLMPGIQGGSEGSSGFFVRGGTPDQNLIILDDAVVYNSNHLFGFFSVFNGDAIKSVEAFKGGFPARFGGRLSSVIKLDMKDGNKEKLSGKVNIGLISSSALLEGPINKGKTSFIASGRRTYADIMARPFIDSEKGNRTGYYFTDFNFKIHHIFSPKDKLFWSNYFGQDKFYDNSVYEDGDRDKSRLQWGNITSTLRWNHQFNNKLFSNTSLIFSNYKFKILIEEDFEDQKYEFKSSSGINDYTLKTDFDYYPNSQHTIRFGANATIHNFTPQRLLLKDEFNPNIDKEQELNSFEGAVYVEDDWKLTDKLSLSPGLRLSYFNYKDKHYVNPEPRLALSYNMKTDLAFKASYSRMNQYIHLLSSSGIGLPTDLWVSSTDNIKPQTSQQFAVGVAKDFFDKDYSITLEGYYKTLDDVIAYKEGASFLAIDDLETGKNSNWEENITSGQGWAYGAEILLRKQTGPLTGWLGYTLSWSERQFDELNLGQKFYDRYDRRHDISLVGIYKPNEKITLSGTWVLSTGNNYTLPNQQHIANPVDFPIINTGVYNNSTGMENFTTQRNNFRGETSHRLDLGVQFHKKKKKDRERIWGFSLYNAYARKNPFIYTIDNKDNDSYDPDAPIEKQLTRTSVLILIPSINYTFKF